MNDMNETAKGFLDFLRSMDLRVFQERDIGLDIYLSGPWGYLPVFLAAVSATVFLLAIFQFIPRLRHSVPILLAAGLLAAGIGTGGTYLRYRAHLRPDAPTPAILAQTKEGSPERKPGQTEALLALPFLIGGLTLAADIGGVVFIALASGRSSGKKQKN